MSVPASVLVDGDCKHLLTFVVMRAYIFWIRHVSINSSLQAGMEHALSALIAWKNSTPRRRFLIAAATQLYSCIDAYASAAVSKLSSPSDDLTPLTVRNAALTMLLWHWQATAPLLCSRSDAIINIRDKIGAAKAIKDVFQAAVVQLGKSNSIRESHVDIDAARLRQLCVVFDLMKLTPIQKHQSDPKFPDYLSELSKSTQNGFTVWIVRLIEQAVACGDPSTTQLATEVFQWTIIDSSDSAILQSPEDQRTLLKQLLTGLPTVKSEAKHHDSAKQSIETLATNLIVAQKIPAGYLISLLKESKAPHHVQVLFIFRLPKRATTLECLQALWSIKSGICHLFEHF